MPLRQSAATIPSKPHVLNTSMVLEMTTTQRLQFILLMLLIEKIRHPGIVQPLELHQLELLQITPGYYFHLRSCTRPEAHSRALPGAVTVILMYEQQLDISGV